MGMHAQDILDLLTAAFPGAEIELKNSERDQEHYSLVIESEAFFQKTLLQQHRMVYAALGTQVGTDLHALSIQTKVRTPKRTR